MPFFRSLSLVLLVAACGAPSATTGDAGPGNTAPSSTTSLDPAQCTPFAASLFAAVANCGARVASAEETSFETWCKKGVSSAAMCGGDPAAGLASFAALGVDAWTCMQDDVYPTCGGDLGAALGAACLVALGNPSCSSGIACTGDADCNGGLSCNSVTKQCFTVDASCVGLPCQSDLDCPQSERCNADERACAGM